MDPRIRIRIHTKMSWIRNTDYNNYPVQADALEGDGRGGEAVRAAGPPAAQPAALQALPAEPHRQTSRG